MANSNNNCSCSGLDLIALASSLAILISKNADTDDLNILSSFFSALGDNIALIATSRSICESNEENDKSEKSSNQSDEFFCNFDDNF